jgi:predicted nucleic acid-binding Zn ribbon protein
MATHDDQPKPLSFCSGCGTPIPYGQKYCGGDCRANVEVVETDDDRGGKVKRRPPGTPQGR